MIELLVTAQGLSVHQAMYAVALTEAKDRVQVVEGAAHPPTYVAADAAWGLYEVGHTAGRGMDEWLRAVYGEGSSTLLPLRRVNVVNAGEGITLALPRAGVVKLRIRPADGGAMQEFDWAGPADYSVDGLVDIDDLLAFLDAWQSGGADFDGDGESTIMDLLDYMAVWQSGDLECVADANGDGVVDVFDLLAYLEWWHMGDPRAEIAGVSPDVVDIFDLLAFMNAWFEGC